MSLVTRGALSIFALFLLSGALGDLFRPGFDQSIWLLDLRGLPHLLRSLVLFGCGGVLLALALTAQPSDLLSRVSSSVLVAFALGLLWQSAQFYLLRGRSGFTPGIPIPLTLLIACALIGVLYLLNTARWDATWRWMPFAGGAALAFIALPLCQMFFFGNSDYRRQADAIVVLGARTYAGGRMSDALTDRMRTAVELYKEGCAPRMIVSGGPGDGAIHETEAMRSYAVLHGVPLSAIELDRDGVNTDETAQYVGALARAKALRTVLAVSHAYHLPRVKMTFERCGVHAFTVPAKERYTLRKMPYLVAREVAALWKYYLLPSRAV